MDLGLAGRVFLVAGGSRGLGFASAAALVAEGARVLMVSRDEARLTEATAKLGGRGHAVGLACDIADEACAERAVAATVARFSRLDGCVLSTGGPEPGSIMWAKDDQWRAAFERVVLGSLRLARAVASATTLPDGVAGTGGSILFVLSSSVRSPVPGLAISNALRPGLAASIKELADELGPRGMRVNGLAPGRFATDRVFALDARMGSPEAVRRRNEATIPLGRYGEPEEFGRMAAFVCSPACSYLTGTVVVLDGGITRCP